MLIYINGDLSYYRMVIIKKNVNIGDWSKHVQNGDISHTCTEWWYITFMYRMVMIKMYIIVTDQNMYRMVIYHIHEKSDDVSYTFTECDVSYTCTEWWYIIYMYRMVIYHIHTVISLYNKHFSINDPISFTHTQTWPY